MQEADTWLDLARVTFDRDPATPEGDAPRPVGVTFDPPALTHDVRQRFATRHALDRVRFLKSLDLPSLLFGMRGRSFESALKVLPPGTVTVVVVLVNFGVMALVPVTRPDPGPYMRQPFELEAVMRMLSSW